MSDIRTNRDLYRFVAALTKRHAKERPQLEDYLERLRAGEVDGREAELVQLPPLSNLPY